MNAFDQVVKDAEAKADKIIEQTRYIRDEYAVGHPNCSDESTVEGTLKALDLILKALPEED